MYNTVKLKNNESIHQVFILVLFTILLLASQFAISQRYVKPKVPTDPEILKKSAKDAFINEDYKFALDCYLTLLKLDSTNIEYRYQVGICYIESNVNKRLAVPYLKQVSELNKSYRDINYYLGRALMLDYRFAEAVEIFTEYTLQRNPDKTMLSQVNRYIEMCYNAIKMMENPVDVSFENLGPNINSPSNDYHPYVTSDEDILVFSSDRRYDSEFMIYIKDVYISQPKGGEWKKAKQLPVSSYDDQEIAGFTSDGQTLFIYEISYTYPGDILLAEKKGKNNYLYATNRTPYGINTKLIENSASITKDGNTLYFASNREGGYGGMDIYVIRKLPNGTWSVPSNCGVTINTQYDDAYPNVTENNDTLYFASSGHNSIGGYDLFYSTWDKINNEWSMPINLGYPINTTDDDYTISFTSGKRHAYIAANRKEGLGDLDIYRITFNKAEKIYSVLRGGIFVGNAESSSKFTGDYKKVVITIFDENQNIFGMYMINPRNEKYIASLPPGKYTLNVKAEGYEELVEPIKIFDKSEFKPEIERNIYLKPKSVE